MDKVSIVIPNYNKWALVHQTLFDIYKTCSPVHEIIVVNDGCTEPESFTGLEWWIDNKMLPVRELRLEKNVNFLKASNAGLKEATGDIVILLSNDVRVHGNFVSTVVLTLKNYYWNGNALIGGRLYINDTGWNKFEDKVYSYVEGWLLATTKENWEELGYFDETYSPHDFEDVDLSTTAVEKGYGLIQLPDGLVTHLVAQSLGYNPQREEITKQNREKFREKWIKNKVKV